MSDGISEAWKGTYFRDRSKLPFGYDISKEIEPKISLLKRFKIWICKKINCDGTF